MNLQFGNQAWTLAVQLASGAGFVDVATVNYQPIPGAPSDGSTTKVTLSGLNVTGVQFLRVTANQVNGGANDGNFVWRELDVFGVPSNDETLPDARVSVSGAALTINPDSDLAISTHFAVQIAATAIDDLADNSFAGIADDTTWDFTTGVPDLTAPAIVTLSPTDSATAAGFTPASPTPAIISSSSAAPRSLGTTPSATRPTAVPTRPPSTCAPSARTLPLSKPWSIPS